MANDAQLKLSYEQLESAANSLRMDAIVLEKLLNTAKEHMNETAGVEGVFEGTSSNKIREQFDTEVSTFNAFKDDLDRYSAFLTETVNKYKTADTSFKVEEDPRESARVTNKGLQE